MISTSGFLSVVLLLFSSVSQGQMIINANHQEITTTLGDEVELICSVPASIKACTFRSPSGVTMFIWPGEKFDGERIHQIGEAEKDCGIKITSIKEEDNGFWECNIAAFLEGTTKTGNEKSSIQVIVAVPPTSLQLLVNETPLTSNHLNINLDEQKEVQNIKCTAFGGRPAPTFTWTLGPEVLEGEIEESKETPDSVSGLLKYSQTLKYSPNIKHNGKTLSCTLHHLGYSQVAKTELKNQQSFQIILNFKPREKAKEDVFYISSQQEVEKIIRIKFEASPEPSEISWSLPGLPSPLAMGATSMDGKYESSMLESGDISGEYSVQLTMKDISPSDTNVLNTLSVANEVGATIYPFKLILGAQPPSDENPLIKYANDSKDVDSMDSSSSAIIIIIVVIVLVLLIGGLFFARSRGLLCFSEHQSPDVEAVPEETIHGNEGSDTESAAANQKESHKKSKNKKSSGISKFLAVVKKSVAKKDKIDSKGPQELKMTIEESETQDVTYVDLDKSALSHGRQPLSDVEPTEYAEIQHSKSRNSLDG